MRDGSSWVEPVLSYDKCVLLKDHNAVTPVRLEPAALRSRVKHSTTEPLRSLCFSHKYIMRVEEGSGQNVEMSRGMRFPTMWYVRPAKPQISLRIRAI